MTHLRKIPCLAFLLFFLAWAGSAQAQAPSEEDINLATAAVVKTTGNLGFALEAFSRAVSRTSPFCSLSQTTALSEAGNEGSQLESDIEDLEEVLSAATPAQAQIAEEAILEGRARLDALGDSLTWTPPSGGLGQVEWCGGFHNCLVLRAGCTGCFKCYVGLIDCGCFNPCP